MSLSFIHSFAIWLGWVGSAPNKISFLNVFRLGWRCDIHFVISDYPPPPHRPYIFFGFLKNKKKVVFKQKSRGCASSFFASLIAFSFIYIHIIDFLIAFFSLHLSICCPFDFFLYPSYVICSLASLFRRAIDKTDQFKQTNQIVKSPQLPSNLFQK